MMATLSARWLIFLLLPTGIGIYVNIDCHAKYRQTTINLEQGPINLRQAPINLRQALINLRQGPINILQKPVNLRQVLII